MKQKRLIGTAVVAAMLCVGSVNSASALSQEPIQAAQEIQIQPHYDYIPQI